MADAVMVAMNARPQGVQATGVPPSGGLRVLSSALRNPRTGPLAESEPVSW
jgi:hypothetical protein